MNITRRRSKIIKIGRVYIGGNNPVAIQSMTKTKTSDIEATINEINGLEKAGCEIVRLALKDIGDAKALRKIRKRIDLPIVADIHFNWRLAIEAIDSGVDKIRLNPANIYKKEQIRQIVSAAKLAGIPIRVGVNSGSVRGTTQAAGRTTISELMVKGALDYIKILEGFKFYEIVVSLKGSDIFDTLKAYRKIARICDYPLHLGVTATGPSYSGAIKSSIALGVLLLAGIGDTIRISLTDKPAQEVKVAKIVLGALGLRCFGPEIISCPTCGRCEVDLIRLVNNLGDRLLATDSKFPTRIGKIAVMGCVVNGPGEAKEADIGVAFGEKEGLIFKSGSAIRKVSVLNCIDVLLKEMRG